MNIIKKINKFCGICTLLAFATIIFDIMAIEIDANGPVFYISGLIFLFFAAIFLITAAIFMIRDFTWYMQNGRFWLFIRHYLYAVAAIFIICVLLDYVFNYTVNLPCCLQYAFCLGVIRIYADGYRLNSDTGSTN